MTFNVNVSKNMRKNLYLYEPRILDGAVIAYSNIIFRNWSDKTEENNDKFKPEQRMHPDKFITSTPVINPFQHDVQLNII